MTATGEEGRRGASAQSHQKRFTLRRQAAKEKSHRRGHLPSGGSDRRHLTAGRRRGATQFVVPHKDEELKREEVERPARSPYPHLDRTGSQAAYLILLPRYASRPRLRCVDFRALALSLAGFHPPRTRRNRDLKGLGGGGGRNGGCHLQGMEHTAPMRRMIVLVTEDQHAALKKTAAPSELTLSNYVRKALGLPPERQGKPHKDAA
jgi:hypothetical protein